MCIYMNLYLFVCTVCIIVVLFMVLENRYATLDTEIKVEYSAFLLGCRQSRTLFDSILCIKIVSLFT